MFKSSGSGVPVFDAVYSVRCTLAQLSGGGVACLFQRLQPPQIDWINLAQNTTTTSLLLILKDIISGGLHGQELTDVVKDWGLERCLNKKINGSLVLSFFYNAGW